MSAVPKNLLFTHVHKKLLQMYGETKNLYITYSSVRNININNNTKKKRKFNIILYNIYNIIQNPPFKKKSISYFI